MEVSRRQAHHRRRPRHHRPRPLPGRPVGQGRGQPVPRRQAAAVDRDLRPGLVGVRRGAAARLGAAHRPGRSTASSPSTWSRWPTCCASPGPSRPRSTARSTPRNFTAEARRRLRHLSRQRRPQGPQPGDRPRLRRPPLRARQGPREDRVAARLGPRRATSRSGCATPTCRPRSPTSASPATCPTPTHDYLAVFNQNTNISKSDYWQKRTVTSDVQLREDGSAEVEMTDLGLQRLAALRRQPGSTATTAGAAAAPAGTA